MGRTARTAVAALGTVGLMTAVAVAHDTSFESRVTAHFRPDETGDRINGRVISSEKPACEPQRLVKIFRKQAGDDVKRGDDRTNSDGEYSAAPDTGMYFESGNYYAKVVRKDLGEGGHDHVCKGDRSQEFVVGM